MKLKKKVQIFHMIVIIHILSAGHPSEVHQLLNSTVCLNIGIGEEKGGWSLIKSNLHFEDTYILLY